MGKLYDGLTICLVRAFFVNSLAFYSYDFMKETLNNYYIKKNLEEVIENIIINKKLISNNTENIMVNNMEMSNSQQKETDILTPNTYYVGDNIELLKNVKSDSINLIYFDPPYNTGRNFFNFDDRFNSVEEYVTFIKERIKECFRCLKPCGNILIHIEPKISHYFRIICDEIFGINNFKNEIIWVTGGNAKNLYQLNRFHDTIIVYSKKEKVKVYLILYIFHMMMNIEKNQM